MTHRHLFPDEIDLLLDGEVGFGVAPLKAHVRECADCRAELAEARALAEMLDHVPHFAPAPRFADRVMANVHVFVPWHVAARESVQRLVPRSEGLRAAAAGVAVGVATLLTLATLWLVVRADALIYVAGVAFERGRLAVLGGLGDLVAATFGPAALAVLRGTGPTGVALALLALLGATLIATLTLRRVVTAAARQRV